MMFDAAETTHFAFDVFVDNENLGMKRVEIHEDSIVLLWGMYGTKWPRDKHGKFLEKIENGESVSMEIYEKGIKDSVWKGMCKYKQLVTWKENNLIMVEVTCSYAQ